MTEVLESVMLICFGLSWPISVIKNIKAHTAKNMSLKFILPATLQVLQQNLFQELLTTFLPYTFLT